MISFVSAVEQGAEATALKVGEWIDSKKAALDGTSYTSDLDWQLPRRTYRGVARSGRQ